MTTPDLTYSCPDGIWTRFYPETSQGEDAWRVMAEAMPGGVVAFLPLQVTGVLTQLRAAGLTVRKAKKRRPLTRVEVDTLLDALAS